MTDRIKIGDRWIGKGEPCCIVAEIGINHNGDMDNARQLIDAAAEAGCETVKLQKRTVGVVYTPTELAVAGMLSELQTLRGEWLESTSRSAGLLDRSTLWARIRRVLRGLR